MDKKLKNAHHIFHGGEHPLTKQPKPNKTNTQEVRQQNAQSAQQTGSNTWEEFGAETDVKQVKQQNKQSEMKKRNATSQKGQFK